MPLFPTLLEPGQYVIGNILPLTTGHNGKPSSLEQELLTLHLDRAGFL